MAKRKKKTKAKHIYFVWETEYPEEGAWEVEASSAKEARELWWEQVGDQDLDVEVTVVRATLKQLLKRRDNELAEAQEDVERLRAALFSARKDLEASRQEARRLAAQVRHYP